MRVSCGHPKRMAVVDRARVHADCLREVCFVGCQIHVGTEHSSSNRGEPSTGDRGRNWSWYRKLEGFLRSPVNMGVAPASLVPGWIWPAQPLSFLIPFSPSSVFFLLIRAEHCEGMNFLWLWPSVAVSKVWFREIGAARRCSVAFGRVEEKKPNFCLCCFPVCKPCFHPSRKY